MLDADGADLAPLGIQVVGRYGRQHDAGGRFGRHGGREPGGDVAPDQTPATLRCALQRTYGLIMGVPGPGPARGEHGFQQRCAAASLQTSVAVMGVLAAVPQKRAEDIEIALLHEQGRPRQRLVDVVPRTATTLGAPLLVGCSLEHVQDGTVVAVSCCDHVEERVARALRLVGRLVRRVDAFLQSGRPLHDFAARLVGRQAPLAHRHQQCGRVLAAIADWAGAAGGNLQRRRAEELTRLEA